jgi:hypothetical protein
MAVRGVAKRYARAIFELAQEAGKAGVDHRIGGARAEQQALHPPGQHGGAGKDVSLPLVQRGRQRNRQVFPMDQVTADGMPPVHGTPHGAAGMKLIEEMIFASVIYQTIWIVQPHFRWCEMIIWTI